MDYVGKHAAIETFLIVPVRLATSRLVREMLWQTNSPAERPYFGAAYWWVAQVGHPRFTGPTGLFARWGAKQL